MAALEPDMSLQDKLGKGVQDFAGIGPNANPAPTGALPAPKVGPTTMAAADLTSSLEEITKEAFGGSPSRAGLAAALNPARDPQTSSFNPMGPLAATLPPGGLRGLSPTNLEIQQQAQASREAQAQAQARAQTDSGAPSQLEQFHRALASKVPGDTVETLAAGVATAPLTAAGLALQALPDNSRGAFGLLPQASGALHKGGEALLKVPDAVGGAVSAFNDEVPAVTAQRIGAPLAATGAYLRGDRAAYDANMSIIRGSSQASAAPASALPASAAPASAAPASAASAAPASAASAAPASAAPAEPAYTPDPNTSWGKVMNRRIGELQSLGGNVKGLNEEQIKQAWRDKNKELSDVGLSPVEMRGALDKEIQQGATKAGVDPATFTPAQREQAFQKVKKESLDKRARDTYSKYSWFDPKSGGARLSKDGKEPTRRQKEWNAYQTLKSNPRIDETKFVKKDGTIDFAGATKAYNDDKEALAQKELNQGDAKFAAGQAGARQGIVESQVRVDKMLADAEKDRQEAISGKPLTPEQINAKSLRAQEAAADVKVFQGSTPEFQAAYPGVSETDRANWIKEADSILEDAKKKGDSVWDAAISNKDLPAYAQRYLALQRVKLDGLGLGKK